MPDLRYNLVTGDWVILAPERAKRRDVFHTGPGVAAGPAYMASCPFCPGNESETAAEIVRVPRDGPWALRGVENRFPALTPEGEVTRLGRGYTRTMAGVGRHEVVVESPLHNVTTALLPVAHVADVLQVYRDRMRAIYTDRRVEHVVIFKNHGVTAGSSLDHPHTQIVGTPVVPGQTRVRIEEALRMYGELGECVYCYTLHEEIDARVRIIEETPTFVAFVPYAALSPFHIWILPKRHGAYFGAVTDPELESLAGVLQRTLLRIYRGLGNAHFNYVIRSLSPAEAEVKYCHWYVSIVVRVTRAAGFELGTGMFINPSLPEESARFLREVPL